MYVPFYTNLYNWLTSLELNGMFSVANSYSKHPSDHKSDFSSYGSYLQTYGLQNYGLPFYVMSNWSFTLFDAKKSQIFTVPSLKSKIFEALSKYYHSNTDEI